MTDRSNADSESAVEVADSLAQKSVLLEQLPFADQVVVLDEEAIRKGCAPFGTIENLQSTPHAQADHRQWLITFTFPPKKGIFLWTTKHGLQLTYPDEKAVARILSPDGPPTLTESGEEATDEQAVQDVVSDVIDGVDGVAGDVIDGAVADVIDGVVGDVIDGVVADVIDDVEKTAVDGAVDDTVDDQKINEIVDDQPVSGSQSISENQENIQPMDTSDTPERQKSPQQEQSLQKQKSPQIPDEFLPPPEIQAKETLPIAQWTPPSLPATGTYPPQSPLSKMVFPVGFPTPPPGFTIPPSFEKVFVPPPLETIFAAPKVGFPFVPPAEVPDEYIPGAGIRAFPAKPVLNSVLSRPSALDQAPGDHCIRCGRKDHSFLNCAHTRTIANRAIAPMVDGSLLNPHSGDPYCSKYQQDRCTNKHCHFLHTCSLCHRRGHGAARCFDATGKSREEIPTLASGTPAGYPPVRAASITTEDIEDLSYLDAETLRQRLSTALLELKRVNRLRAEEASLLQERSSRVIEMDRIVRRLEHDVSSNRRREESLEQVLRERDAANHQLVQERDQAMRDCKQAIGDFEAESHFRRGLDRKVLTLEEELNTYRRGPQVNPPPIDYQSYHSQPQQSMSSYPSHPRSSSNSFQSQPVTSYNTAAQYPPNSNFHDERNVYRNETDLRGAPSKRPRHEEGNKMPNYVQPHLGIRQENFPIHSQQPMQYNQNLPAPNMYGPSHLAPNHGNRY